MSDRPSQRPRLLLIGWNAADWKRINPLLDAGKLPNLRRLIEQGSMGRLSSLTPRISALLWTSIATGKRADQHGILDATQLDPSTGLQCPIGAAARRSDAVWDLLAQAGLKSHVVNWSATHPAQSSTGIAVSDRFNEPGTTGAIQPARYEPIFENLRLDPSDLSAEHILPFIPRLGEIDQARDRRSVIIAAILARTAMVHAVATWILEHEAWDFLTVQYRSLEEWGGAFGRYAAPVSAGVSPRDAELYGNVIEAGYRFHDMMLGRLLELAGEDAIVMLVSDHGGRGPGIFAMRGPGIRADELIHGAGLLDVAPTILTLLGVGVPNDMEGRPLLAAWNEPPSVFRAPTAKIDPGENRALKVHSDTSDELQEALRELEAQGYGDTLDKSIAALADEAGQKTLLHLVQVHLGAGRPERALPLLEQMNCETPGSDTILLFLAYSHYSLHKFDRCREVLSTMRGESIDRPLAQLLLAMTSLAGGRSAEALDRLIAAEQTHRREPQVLCFLGHAYCQLNRHVEAKAAFDRCLAIDEDCAPAHFGIALSYAQQQRWTESADWALRAVGINHFQPESHFLLGVCLARLGDPGRAVIAFENVIAQRPTHAAAHEWLARIHQHATGDASRAAHHHTLAQTGRQFQGAM
jgi:predicted AlkP superfamily phosphohydrolase/phosphomutase/Tfp pilus assembly protein PilF